MSKELTHEQQLAALDRLACGRAHGRGSRGYQANWRDKQREDDLKYGRPGDAPKAQCGRTAPGTDLMPVKGDSGGGEPLGPNKQWFCFTDNQLKTSLTGTSV